LLPAETVCPCLPLEILPFNRFHKSYISRRTAIPVVMLSSSLTYQLACIIIPTPANLLIFATVKKKRFAHDLRLPKLHQMQIH
jgi:hypothetical protein